MNNTDPQTSLEYSEVPPPIKMKSDAVDCWIEGDQLLMRNKAGAVVARPATEQEKQMNAALIAADYQFMSAVAQFKFVWREGAVAGSGAADYQELENPYD